MFAYVHVMYKVQRSITQKIYTQELWFLSSACCPMLVNIYMKFHEDILNGFQVIERTLFCNRYCLCLPMCMVRTKFVTDTAYVCLCAWYIQSSKGHNSKNIYPRVLVLALCTSSYVG